nr:POTRA domain-containing protein [uncultured Carboxylicivirga sp.]
MQVDEGDRSVLVILLLIILTTYSFEAYGRELKTNGEEINTEDSVLVRQVIITGNKVTKPRVILNELEFKAGDRIKSNLLGQLISRSRDNLLNTSLFNFVTITYSDQLDGTMVFQIKVDERWYWWVFPIFEHTDRNLSSFLASGDWSRMNYGIYLKRDNFRGRKELLKVRFKTGFSTQFTLRFDSPEYKRKTGWGAEITGKAFNKVPYATIDNQPVFMTINNDLAQFYLKAALNYGIRSNLYQRHKLELTYEDYNVSDSIVEFNPNYLTKGDARMEYLSLSYNYEFDKRDSKIYPLQGTALNITASKIGLGLVNSKLNDWSLKAHFQQYAELRSRLHWGGEFVGRLGSSDELPYVLNQGIGYKGFMNGYELYVLDGVRNAMVQNKLIFTLMEPKVKSIGFMPLTQFAKVHYAFYLKAFFDNGYAWQNNADVTNDMVNSWQYGYGVGLDFVTFYDKVFSFNYSINKLGYHGFFVHFNLEM